MSVDVSRYSFSGWTRFRIRHVPWTNSTSWSFWIRGIIVFWNVRSASGIAATSSLTRFVCAIISEDRSFFFFWIYLFYLYFFFFYFLFITQVFITAGCIPVYIYTGMYIYRYIYIYIWRRANESEKKNLELDGLRGARMGRSGEGRVSRGEGANGL